MSPSWRRGISPASHGATPKRAAARSSCGRPGMLTTQPVKARDAATTSLWVYSPRPTVKSSITSRPKFSLRRRTELLMPSRYTSIAGSLATAWRSSAKLPVACCRIVRCWRYMR